MTNPANVLAAALPKNHDDHGPIAIPSDAVRQVLAEHARYLTHSQKLNSIAWRIASSLGDIPPGAGEHQGDIDTLLERTVAVIENARATQPGGNE